MWGFCVDGWNDDDDDDVGDEGGEMTTSWEKRKDYDYDENSKVFL